MPEFFTPTHHDKMLKAMLEYRGWGYEAQTYRRDLCFGTNTRPQRELLQRRNRSPDLTAFPILACLLYYSVWLYNHAINDALQPVNQFDGCLLIFKLCLRLACRCEGIVSTALSVMMPVFSSLGKNVLGFKTRKRSLPENDVLKRETVRVSFLY